MHILSLYVLMLHIKLIINILCVIQKIMLAKNIKKYACIIVMYYECMCANIYYFMFKKKII